jgi:ribosomal protein S18 acetylase RimI-like enzyme
VPALELQPFSADHLEAAAELLAARHAGHVAAEPLLPADVDFRAEVAALWAKEGASGAVGLRDGRVAGYVLGTRLDESWGPNAWIELAGHAVEQPEDVRDVYGFAAERWVEEGRTHQYVYVPASDRALIDAWFRVGFGAQHAFAIRELHDYPAPDLPDITVREAEERDIEAMVKIAPELTLHQMRSPVFSRRRVDYSDEELRTEFREDLANAKIGNLVAELDGRVVGNFVVVPIELSSAHVGLARPPGVAHLGFAATLPEARGWGAGLALTAASFAWAREQGYEVMVTDWRVTNLLSSRFWPRRGFRETFLRLYRSIP